LPYKCRRPLLHLTLASGSNAPQCCRRSGGRRFSPSRRPLGLPLFRDGSPARDPLALVWEREEEDRGKTSTARSNVTVRLCYLHKFRSQLQTCNGSLSLPTVLRPWPSALLALRAFPKSPAPCPVAVGYPMQQAQPLAGPAAGPASIESRASVGQLSDRQRERARIVGDRGNALTRRAANNLNQVGWRWRALVAPCPLCPRKRTCAVHSSISAEGSRMGYLGVARGAKVTARH